MGRYRKIITNTNSPIPQQTASSEEEHKSSNRHNTSQNLYSKAMNTAVRILTARDHSKYELVQKLKKRKYKNDIIDQVISACEHYNYINDERTAQVYIRQLNKKGYGLKRIRYELSKKGLKGSHINGILSESLSEEDQRNCAWSVFQKHFTRFEKEKDLLKRKNKIFRFLYSRGFSEGIISEIIKKVD